MCAADVVITHAGQSCVADVAAARRPAIVLPQPRPFDEQHATAETLRRHRLAVATRGWPDARAWRCFIGRARASDPSRWEQWQTSGAARAPLKPSRPRCVNTQRRTCHEDRVITTAHGRPPHLHRQLDGISRSATLPDTHVIVAIDDHAVSGVVAASGNTAHVVHCDVPPGPLPVASAAISARSPR